MTHKYQGVEPKLHPSVYLAPGAQVIGDVSIGEDSSVWFNAVLRGDVAPIIIGRRSNVQDLAVGHTDENQPLIIEDGVTIGHAAIVHGCTIRRGALIGMGAVILNGAEIGEYAMIGAGAVVTEGTVIPPRSLALGVPAKVVRQLNEEDLKHMKNNAANYVRKGKQYRAEQAGEPS
ncbi:gamma carbonic anhydrase family protein [Insulibacter thermoxylanivorax]|uniref:Gamma carbonic anhydrase family protein n=1 Tax=Insulibacter thermoxylanivorax TaxID=2749268 RepID=A0A916QD51_9BACL|nr:gamma carbonic anhydrase family protein [Insulibacter thermoxylanivorax]GFR36903.1 gamma carbonic anhydrase family protein [Insulibacter thermoxylanivorax]